MIESTMDRSLPALEILAGVLLIVSVLRDAFETMILPRRLNQRFRLTRLYYRGFWPVWRGLGRRIRNRSRREYLLSWFGPMSLLVLFGLWAVGLMAGFALMDQGLGSPLAAAGARGGFGGNLFASGVTFLTMNLGTATPPPGAARPLAVLEGGLGLGFIAVIISYLPVLYAGFSAREANITMLDAHAGSPPSASELLVRGAGSIEQLRAYLHDWERWSAQLLESQISYPVLGYFRSQHVNQSWLAALTALLDACALILAGAEGECARQARLTFAMARHAVVDLAQIFVRELPPHIPERLPAEDLARLRAQLDAAGLHLRLDEDGAARLRRLRHLYEREAFAISRHLLLEVPPWIGDPHAPDNWERSPWQAARHLDVRTWPREGHF